MSAYFLWLNSEGRDKIKVFFIFLIRFKFRQIYLITGGEPKLWCHRGVKESW